MKQYYYLISSLYDLIIDDTKKVISIREFIDFCSEQLDTEDFDNLKRLFLFNDIRNAVNYSKEKSNYLTPSYYTEDEFNENQKDRDLFFPFLAQYYFNKSNEKRIIPELKEIDELVFLFYENLESFESQFIKDYFLFELDLQNITTALSARKYGLDAVNKVIPYGDFYDKIRKSTSDDFGLSGDVTYIEQIVEAYKSGDVLSVEKKIEDIRFAWLDERVENTDFSVEAVFSYAVKLNSVDRWSKMTDDRGREVLDKLIEKIKSSINFGEEFLTSGGKSNDKG